VIRRRVAQHSSDAWLKFKDAHFTWEQVVDNIHRAANGLLEPDIRPGERVAIMMGNRPNFCGLTSPSDSSVASAFPSTPHNAAPLHITFSRDSDSTAVIFEELKEVVMTVMAACRVSDTRSRLDPGATAPSFRSRAASRDR
jgi:long-subunit acyl-CoA synthetase (AMP-forming)